MDNMGEAADLNRNFWPADKPIGSHYSVTSSLPRMLSLLKTHSIKATYFIEAWNCGVYPDAIRSVADAGHEVAYHAWQHEVWKDLDITTEVGNLDKSVAAVDGLMGTGWRYRGFRPPGGLMTDRTLDLMRERGFKYLSPAAERCAVVEGVAVVPFRWREIDAYFYLPSLGPVREREGDGMDVLSAAVYKGRLLDRVRQVSEEGGYSAFLFHPFLTDAEERMEVMRDVLTEVGKNRDEGTIWVATCEEVAEWVLRNKEEFGCDPKWDRVEWKKK